MVTCNQSQLISRLGTTGRGLSDCFWITLELIYNQHIISTKYIISGLKLKWKE